MIYVAGCMKKVSLKWLDCPGTSGQSEGTLEEKDPNGLSCL